MIIDEKGLVRAIKRAYTTYGYNVLNLGRQVAVYTDTWYISCEWINLPRKALGIIVEHIGMLPPEGNAMTMRKKEDPQVIMPEAVQQTIECWTAGTEDRRATIVPIMYKGYQLYQDMDSLTCYAMDPDDLGIVDGTFATCKAAGVRCGSHMTWQHDDEIAVILAGRRSAFSTMDWERGIWTALESVDLHRRDE